MNMLEGIRRWSKRGYARRPSSSATSSLGGDFSDVRAVVRGYWLLLEPELSCYMPNGRQQMTCW